MPGIADGVKPCQRAIADSDQDSVYRVNENHRRFFTIRIAEDARRASTPNTSEASPRCIPEPGNPSSDMTTGAGLSSYLFMIGARRAPRYMDSVPARRRLQARRSRRPRGYGCRPRRIEGAVSFCDRHCSSEGGCETRRERLISGILFFTSYAGLMTIRSQLPVSRVRNSREYRPVSRRLGSFADYEIANTVILPSLCLLA